MTEKDKPDIQNSGTSNEPETATQPPIPTEDKTLLQSDALLNEAIDEPTRRFDAPVDDTEPTQIFSDSETETNVPDENALRSSRLRFAFVCLFFIFVGGANVINLYQVFALTSIKTGGTFQWTDDRLVLTSVAPESADRMKVGDEILGFNGESIDKTNYKKISAPMKANEQYTLQIKSEGETELREVKLVTKPLPVAVVLNQYLTGIFLPATFLICGLTIFLLKSNDKQVLLTSVLFAVMSVVVAPKQSSFLELPKVFALWWRAGFLVTPFFIALLLHLFMVFPKRSRLVRRFPNLEWLIYLPLLPLFLLIGLQQLSLEGWTQLNFVFELTDNSVIFTPIIFFYPVLVQGLYLFAALTILFLNFSRTEESGKRRIRLMVVGFTVALVPAILNVLVGIPVGVIFGVNWLNFLGDWEAAVFWSPWLLMPVAFGYAIVRHKVIPISFVLRRGLQYLLAKNALRLLLILPAIGIIWNVAANPNRTVYEILFQNSFSFYFFVALAVIDGWLMRSRLNEWIDKKFFREQYNQEKILRELTEAVKESDSMAKLSRLVSSKIQLSLHPENVYLFFRDDATNSDFSLGYTTNGASGNSANLKFAAESPLLRFMQNERGAVEFPTRRADDLPNREKRWLREISANLLVPMHGSDGRLAGIFTLGEKMSQIPYTSRDKELLETLANQIALVHENLNLKDRVRRDQKIRNEILSRFDEDSINLLKECPKCGRCFDRDSLKCADDNSNLTFTLPVERTIENRYRLEKLIGKGGMGAVYQATDTRINRQVAVKILSGAMFGNKNALRRFEREAQTAGKLNHRNIVTVFDYGVLSTEGAFLVMELVKGESLREILDREEKLTPEIVVSWFGQVLDGVEAAHQAGIIHRDLKPENILVTQTESGAARVCILDFGLAREQELAENVTAPGTVMGTFGYMPPEQLRGERTDERSDLFAIAVMIYESLHNAKPFSGKSYHELLTAMSNKVIFNEPFAAFFERGLAQEPENRFASADEMRRDLINSKVE